MTTEDFKRKLTAILSADVVGYSRLMGDDEAATVKTLETYKGVMFSLIKQHRGRVVDSPGDNLLAEFGSVVDAVQCAVSIQKELQTRNADLPDNRRMEFRIGINLGDVIEEDDRIYGDGVNIAARLEALADPGGICVSKTAFDHIESKLPLGYEFLGEQTVKNIPKPIGAYRVLMEPRVTVAKGIEEKKTVPFWRRKVVLSFGIILFLAIAVTLYWKFYLRGPTIEPASIEKMAYPLPDKPSIAVLPFTNMSGDPEQDYIGDGLSENIISALSVSSQMFVMARNATFTYNGTAVKPQQVAEELGIQYILEGSIQKSGNQLRVTAQLIDALSGHHLWSEVYDREMRNLFGLQDEITKKIMVSLQVVLSGSEDARVFSKSTDNLEAWKYFIKGKELFENFIEQDNAKAREHFKTALELDPQYVSAMSYLGNTHVQDAMNGWSDSPSASFSRAFELAQKGLVLDDQNPIVHALLGQASLFQRQYEKAITEGKLAISLDPNFTIGCGVLGFILSHCGEFDEAIPILKKGYRLNPSLDPSFLTYLAKSYIFLERYEEALEVCKQMEEHVLNGRLVGPKYVPPLYYSWIYQELGREEEARAYMAEALKRKPDLSLEWLKGLSPYKDPAHLQQALDAFRKAGMPEKPPGAIREKPSIAVLPFDDLSPEKDQEYFVLGLSEEILSCLSKIPGLHVTSKTSSFAFKNTDKTIKEIAEILGREYILEGSVRKAGNALRITAQLIHVADDRHLWSENYDRELKVKDIYAVQKDIATAVADELKVTLGIGSLKQLGGTENIEAYELYLLASGQQNTLEYDRALKSIDAALALDPEFANAWALKAEIHLFLITFGPSIRSDLERNAALSAAQKAIELVPNLAGVYIILGTSEAMRCNWIDAELSFRKALQMQTETFSQTHYPHMYNTVGCFKKSREIYEDFRRNDPLNELIRIGYVVTLGLLRDTQGVENENERCEALFGDVWKARSWGMTFHRLSTGDPVSRDEIEYSTPIFNAAKEYLDSPKEGLARLHQLYSDESNLSERDITDISILAAYFGDPEFAIEAMEKGNAINASGLFKIWYPVMKEVRQLPRFKEFVREIGLVGYWRKFGWPDLCHPVGDDDFVCD
jgi:adenylate cyclase